MKPSDGQPRMELQEINWGDDSAEKDPYLLEYFVDSAAYTRMRSKSKSMVIGRKGSGKSALRKKLEEDFANDQNTYVINLSPKYNSIRSVLNDQEIVSNYGEEIFFQHTWLRQILLDMLCQIGDEAKGRFAADSMEFARRISLDLNRTSKDLVENISEVLGKIKVKAGSIGELGIQVEQELRNIADVQSLEHHALKLANGGAKFVVLADDLDLGWDNTTTANNMLLGLLAAANHLTAQSSNIFIALFLREDVYALLVSHTQHADKYRNVERIRWEKQALVEILENRIAFNLRQRGVTINTNPFSYVFPETIGTSNTDNWLIERTLSRPRELIQLARYYTESVNGSFPSDGALKDSETNYSSWKLDDLCAEYSNQYSGLIQLFAYWKTKFFRHKYHLSGSEIREMLLQIMAEAPINQAWFNNLVARTDVDGLLQLLYDIGFLGDFVLGGEGGSKTFYSYIERHEPKFEEVQVHPCFRKAVNTVERIRNRKDERL
jgi:hypothetical protein